MLAPAADATSGVTLAGQHLSSDGRLVGAPQIRTLSGSRGAYRVYVPGISAALVSSRYV
jgi:hypothetical protein